LHRRRDRAMLDQMLEVFRIKPEVDFDIVERIVAESRRLLEDVTCYENMIRGKNPYGDGRAAERIREATKFFFDGCQHRHEDFAE